MEQNKADVTKVGEHNKLFYNKNMKIMNLIWQENMYCAMFSVPSPETGH